MSDEQARVSPLDIALQSGAARRPRRRRWAAFGIAAVAVLGIGGYGFASMLNHLGATVQRYYRTLGSGDYTGACAMLTDSAQARLIAQEQAATCEAAAEHWRASLTEAQRDWLVHGHIWVTGYAAEDSRKEVKLFHNPIGIGSWAIFKHDGHETISDWGPDSQKIPPATD